MDYIDVDIEDDVSGRSSSIENDQGGSRRHHNIQRQRSSSLFVPQDEAVGAVAGLETSTRNTRSRSSRLIQGDISRQHPGQPDVLVDLELYPRNHREDSAANHQRVSRSTTVIDLTNEPDSPDSGYQGFMPQVRNSMASRLRRTESQGRQPPSLSRSDSRFLGSPAPFIDLTQDSPELPRRSSLPRDRESPELMILGVIQAQQPASRRMAPRNRPLHFGFAGAGVALGGLSPGFFRSLPFLSGGVNLFGSAQPYRNEPALAEEENVFQYAGMPQARADNPIGNIHLQYRNGAFDPRIDDIPREIPQAKPGFTRNTGADIVAVCPACNEELAYDPDEPPGGSQLPKASKSKRNRSEHHFWALKTCGHVYCEECFENRKLSAKRPDTGFRTDPDDSHRAASQQKILCAVDGCTSLAANKTAWVGIYL